jgi:hypothetical protein
MLEAADLRLLITTVGFPMSLPSRRLGTLLGAISISTIASSAEAHENATTSAIEETMAVLHKGPLSIRGWTAWAGGKILPMDTSLWL